MARGHIDRVWELPEAIVLWPDYDESLRYLPETRGVEDPRTGERFFAKGPHNTGFGHFSIVSPARRPVVEGVYDLHVVALPDGSEHMVYEIVRTADQENSPIEYDAARLAAFIRARAVFEGRGGWNPDRKVMVVDTRGLRAQLDAAAQSSSSS